MTDKARLRPLKAIDYLLGFIALASQLVVAFVSFFFLIFGLGGAGNNGGMSRIESIALFAWLAGILATIYFFIRFLRSRYYIRAIVVSWMPIVMFVVLVYAHEKLFR